MQYRVLFGMRFEEDRLRFAPVVPKSYAGTRELRGVRYRGATLTVRVRGWGCTVSQATLDGAVLPNAELPATIRGEHLVELTLGAECATTSAPSASAAVTTRPAPATPEAWAVGEGTGRVLRWRAVPGADRYVVHRDGRATDTLRMLSIPVTARDSLAEYQVEAIDEHGVGSFLSEPVRVVTMMAVQEFSPRGTRVTLERASPPVTFRVRIASAGRYALDALYANGSGPINTEDKAAMRTFDIDGVQSGVLVMPQRGAGAWELLGYSNAAVVSLSAGEHTITIRWNQHDENMNGKVSRAILHQLRITRLPNAR